VTSHRAFVLAFAALWAVLLAQSSAFERPEFRPYELLLQGASNFRPNQRLEMEAYGALSYRYVYPEIRDVHPEVFTTDAAGFRNHLYFGTAPKIVVIGDSFIAGVGLSDEDTFPVKLAAELGRPVYNYGAQFDQGPLMFLADSRFVAHPPRLAIYMPSDAAISPIVIPTGKPPPTKKPFLSFGTAEALRHQIGALNRDNGLRQLFRATYLDAHRMIFGFPNLKNVDGEEVLATTIEEQKLHVSPEERKIDEVIESYVAFKELLQKRGTMLFVAPIPESGEIYDFGPTHTPRFRDVLLQRLADEGVDTIDLEPVFRANKRPYLYQRDDPHWSARAVELAAKTVAERVRTIP
jgi:hypothetical protein